MLMREWARRHATTADAGNAIGDFLTGANAAEVARRHGLPLAAAEGVRSFYELIESGSRICNGTSCRFAEGADTLAARLAALEGRPLGHVCCLGHCYAAPSFQSGRRVYARPSSMTAAAWIESWGEGPHPVEDLVAIPRRNLAGTPVVLRNLLPGEPVPAAPWELGARRHEYDLPDGETILAAVDASRLRGRGGAAYPTAAKWRAARDAEATPKVVVANGDEGDPGSYVDRLLLEEDPHAVLAGAVACARAIGATRAVVYIRAEYPHAHEVMRRAIEAARAAGCFGGLEVTQVSGAGSYVCGEETALLNSIEGRRGEPRTKPPYPAESGLFGLPTVVQNVETLAVVPWIVRARRAGGTKAVCVAGAVRMPGVVEVDLGTPLRTVLDAGAGGPAPGRTWKMALIGGPLGRVLPERLFDAPLDYDTLPGMGHGGVVVLDDRVAARALALHLFEFAHHESCGNCAPCRIGSGRLHEMRDRAALERLLETIEIGSLCGFGQGVPRPIRDLIAHFGEEVFA